MAVIDLSMIKHQELGFGNISGLCHREFVAQGSLIDLLHTFAIFYTSFSTTQSSRHTIGQLILQYVFMVRGDLWKLYSVVNFW